MIPNSSASFGHLQINLRLPAAPYHGYSNQWFYQDLHKGMLE
jgi:hypothetical protein